MILIFYFLGLEPCIRKNLNIIIERIGNDTELQYNDSDITFIPMISKEITFKLITTLKNMYHGQCGIIYCNTRKVVDYIELLLKINGIKAVAYYSTIPDDLKKIHFDLWNRQIIPIIVATTAFGLGINKANVRFIYHIGIPDSFGTYVQQIGRAGRDGLPSCCRIFYNFHQYK